MTGWQFLCSDLEFENFWKHYFALDEEYESYRAKNHPKDNYLIGRCGLAWAYDFKSGFMGDDNYFFDFPAK